MNWLASPGLCERAFERSRVSLDVGGRRCPVYALMLVHWRLGCKRPIPEGAEDEQSRSPKQ